jgi:hypothetical protein
MTEPEVDLSTWDEAEETGLPAHVIHNARRFLHGEEILASIFCNEQAVALACRAARSIYCPYWDDVANAIDRVNQSQMGSAYCFSEIFFQYQDSEQALDWIYSMHFGTMI